jgi:hypothetical protein
MVLKPPPRYGERFGKRMECNGLLVVQKTSLMCPYKATVRCVSATASSSALIKTHRSQFLSFGSSNGC